MTEELMTHGEIQSFDHEGGPDWALAPPKLCCELNGNIENFLEEHMKVDNQEKEKTLDYLHRRWAYSNLALEIKQEEGGRITTDPDERYMMQYCLHTHNKRRFINYMQRAAYENEGITIQEVVKLVRCSRRAVETMLKELEPLKVIDQGTNDAGHNTYKASDKLMKFHLNYSKWLFRVSQLIGIRNTSGAILELENLIGVSEVEHVKLLRT